MEALQIGCIYPVMGALERLDTQKMVVKGGHGQDRDRSIGAQQEGTCQSMPAYRTAGGGKPCIFVSPDNTV